MKAKLCPALLVLLCSVPLLGRDETPKVDIFGGYSHASNFDIGLNGWIASANWSIARWIGVEGDISGDYGSKRFGPFFLGAPKLNSHMYSFNFGPSITYRRSKYNAFGHLLFGASHTNVNSAGFDQGDTSFSWVLGGGADYNITQSWAGRFQLDLLRTNFFDRGASHARVGLGIVYRYGTR